MTSSSDGTARIWRLDGTNAATLRGHDGPVVDAGFSPDGARVVTASYDLTARIWSVTDGNLVATLKGHDAALNAAVFSPDGTQVATASADGTARVWNSDGTGKPLVLTGHTQAVTSLAFNHDGTRLATASKDRTARLWDTDKRSPAIVLGGHTGVVGDIDFSPDGHKEIKGIEQSTSPYAQRIAQLLARHGFIAQTRDDLGAEVAAGERAVGIALAGIRACLAAGLGGCLLHRIPLEVTEDRAQRFEVDRVILGKLGEFSVDERDGHILGGHKEIKPDFPRPLRVVACNNCH